MDQAVGSTQAVSKQKGLTWRTMLAFVFIVFIIQPAIVYNWLVQGLWGLAFGSWAVILLWVGLTRLLGTPLNSKEIFVIRIVESTGLVNTGYYFAYLLRNQYFANSEIAQIFGLQHQIPPFYSPLGDDAIRSLLNRTFLDLAWALPILVSVFIPVIMTAVANYVLGLLAFKLYVQEEKLEFPTYSWDALTMKALGERDRDKIRIIALAIIGGLLYGFATYGLGYILGVTLVPRYLVDLTSIIETSLPGASFAIPTDFLFYGGGYLIGFILPLKTTALMFIASMALFFFGNSYITMNNLWPEESKWMAGQGILWLYNRSTIYFWISFIIGWGLAAAVVPLFVRYKTLLKAFTRIGGGSGRSSEPTEWYNNSKYLLLIYLGLAATSIILTMLLVPGFPLWILVIFTLGISFVFTMLRTSSAGTTAGFDFNQLYLRETLIYFSGYRGLDIWFFPQGMLLFFGGSDIASQLKMASIIGLDLKEYTKTYFIIVALGLFGSLLFVSIFWRLNPIPGWAYPYTISAWPVEAMNFWRWQSWLWSGFLFRRDWILTGFGISTALYLVADFVLHFPTIPVIMMTGMLTFPPYVIAQFLGSLASFAIRRFIGPKFWDENKGFLYTGVGIGDGLLMALLFMIYMLGRSTWLKPY